MQLKKVLDEVSTEITPTVNVKKVVKPVIDAIQKELNKRKIKAKVVLGGSVAKETFLKEDHDCDLFVQFAYTYKDKNNRTFQRQSAADVGYFQQGGKWQDHR